MITQQTFDILDNYFKQEVAIHRNLRDMDRWDTTKVEFHLDPIYWDEYHKRISKYTFAWKELKYSEYIDFNTVIPTDEAGIYLFIVKSDNLICGLPQFVLYVGISGEGDSKRPLKERLNDYFNVHTIKKRSKLHRFLGKYYQNTYINYSLFDKAISSTEIEDIEKSLHGFFIPPANDRDFPIEMKPIIKAQFTR